MCALHFLRLACVTVRHARPSFDEVLERLLAMRTKLGSAPTPPLQRYQLPTKAVKARSSDEQVREGMRVASVSDSMGGPSCPHMRPPTSCS